MDFRMVVVSARTPSHRIRGNTLDTSGQSRQFRSLVPNAPKNVPCRTVCRTKHDGNRDTIGTEESGTCDGHTAKACGKQ